MATIAGKYDGKILKIHFDSMNSLFDTYSDYTQETTRFAYAKTISNRKCSRKGFNTLKKGDFVDVLPTIYNTYCCNETSLGWTIGEIMKFDDNSGQVEIGYNLNNRTFLFWTHLDNENEISHFNTKTNQFNSDSNMNRNMNMNMNSNVSKEIVDCTCDNENKEELKSESEKKGDNKINNHIGIPAIKAMKRQESALKECVSCMDDPRCMVCVPCGHLVLCEECADEVQNDDEQKDKCVYCLKPIEKMIKLYSV